jgi:hypothetical protein
MVKIFVLAATLASASAAFADEAALHLMLKDHKFLVSETDAPAGKPLTIMVTNQDSTPAEFESKALRVEKIVPAGGTVSLRVHALAAGRYQFFDDYHEETTFGFLNVK